jgi:hypothetical protein
MKTIRIAGAASYYSDSITAVPELLAANPVPQHLIFDFMAEGTIARIARAVVSPRVDNGAKGMAQQLLELTVPIPAPVLGRS